MTEESVISVERAAEALVQQQQQKVVLTSMTPGLDKVVL
jgi:hypothetical protein